VRRFTLCSLIAVVLLLGISTLALAADVDIEVAKRGLTVFLVTVGAACFGIAIAAFGGALGQALSIYSAVGGIARNPEASGKITVTLIIGLALIESLVIYALVIALIALFAYPMAGPIAKFIGVM
jgi:F-type H+-transporting ATPase subunit c